MKNVFKTVGDAKMFLEKYGFEVKGNAEVFELAMTLSKALAPGLIAIRDNKKYKKYLKELTVDVNACLAAIDVAMKDPYSDERGKLIAEICNVLEMKNDSARYFGLGIDYRTDKKKGQS